MLDEATPQRARLPGRVLYFYSVPLPACRQAGTPPLTAGHTGHLPVKNGRRSLRMEGITLLIAVVALIIAILAYQRTGGTADLKRQIDSATSSVDLTKKVESLTVMTDALREKTADALDRLEKIIRKTEKGE